MGRGAVVLDAVDICPMRAIDGAAHGDEIGLSGRNVDGPFSGGQFEEDTSAPSAVIEHALDPMRRRILPPRSAAPLGFRRGMSPPRFVSAVGVFGE